MNANVKTFSYDRQTVTPGILHFGVGNFHRAHLEYYTNLLMEQHPDQRNWGICGAMILPHDERLYTALKKQNGEYTLTVCGRDGHNQAWLIGSLVELHWGINNAEAILSKIADPAIKIITMTITEGGYNQDRETGEFLLDDEKVRHDINDPKHPVTTFGYVAEGLRRRIAAGAGPITILSCDNLQHNGDTAKRSFTSFFKAQDKALAEWVDKNVTFPNSMVDRITPATTPADIDRLNKANGTHDEAPVYCEDFIQWVVEDNFAAGRPQWEKVGVQFTHDVTAFENMKLSLLNASHQMISFPAFLSGYRKVDAAMRDASLAQLVKEFQDKDFTPYVPAPEGTDLALYKKTLLERFANRAVSDQVARLCFDGASKFPVYVMPHVADMLRDHKDLKRVTFLFAAYYVYLKFRTDDNGERFEVNDPWLTAEDWEVINHGAPKDFLTIQPFHYTDLTASADFVEGFLHSVEAIRSNGAMHTLQHEIL